MYVRLSWKGIDLYMGCVLVAPGILTWLPLDFYFLPPLLIITWMFFNVDDDGVLMAAPEPLTCCRTIGVTLIFFRGFCVKECVLSPPLQIFFFRVIFLPAGLGEGRRSDFPRGNGSCRRLIVLVLLSFFSCVSIYSF